MRPPIIVTGMGRSGTSVTGELLGTHPDTEVRYERSCQVLQKLRMPIRGSLDSAQIDRLREPLREWYGDGQIIVDKNPRWSYRLGALRAIVPEARVVYLIRDGRDVACSVWSGHQKAKKDFTEWARTRPWKHMAEKLEQLPRRAAYAHVWQSAVRCDLMAATGWVGFYPLRYEDLLAGPDAARQLFAWLGLQVTPQVEAFLPNLDSDVSVHLNHFSAPLFVGDHPQRVGRWRNEFTEEERAGLTAATCELLDELGYR
jgi:hypothetical protein